MRKIGILFVALLMTLSSAVAQEIIDGKTGYILVTANGSDTSMLSIDFMYYADEDEAYKKVINDYIKGNTQSWLANLGEKTKSELGEQLFADKLNSFAKEFKKFENGEDGTMIWSLDESIIIEDMESWIQVKISGWSYEGGAHGNGGQSATLFSRDDGRVLKIEDFFTDIDALNARLDPLFRQQKELGPNDDLSEAGYTFPDNKFVVNDNFYFTGRSFTVYFNSYEITDYAGGPTELEVPLGEIEDLLKMDM